VWHGSTLARFCKHDRRLRAKTAQLDVVKLVLVHPLHGPVALRPRLEAARQLRVSHRQEDPVDTATACFSTCVSGSRPLDSVNKVKEMSLVTRAGAPAFAKARPSVCLETTSSAWTRDDVTFVLG
jgi:hypothetical protein